MAFTKEEIENSEKMITDPERKMRVRAMAPRMFDLICKIMILEPVIKEILKKKNMFIWNEIQEIENEITGINKHKPPEDMMYNGLPFKPSMLPVSAPGYQPDCRCGKAQHIGECEDVREIKNQNLYARQMIFDLSTTIGRMSNSRKKHREAVRKIFDEKERYIQQLEQKLCSYGEFGGE